MTSILTLVRVKDRQERTCVILGPKEQTTLRKDVPIVLQNMTSQQA